MNAKAEASAGPDIEVISVDELSWTASEAATSVNKVRSSVEKQAQAAVNWYLREKRPKAMASRFLRLMAIGLATAGGLIPLITSLPAVAKLGLDKWGYVALGAAAACLALDKFFGFSTGWVRYISTAQSIQDDLYGFQIDWARAMSKIGGASPTPAQIDEFLQMAKDFSSRVMKMVSQETQQWVVEFQSNLADLEKTTNAQLQASRPGSLVVNVDNPGNSEQPLSINVDGTDYGTMTGPTWSIRQIAPGPHTVVVTGKKSGKELQQSGVVVVSPAAIAKLELHLP
ncbi:MAG: SLATT domain-containing protein [Acidobacteriia bacterium]|nr:SLATT domain-containing protein [Terriglobia bacterium]